MQGRYLTRDLCQCRAIVIGCLPLLHQVPQHALACGEEHQPQRRSYQGRVDGLQCLQRTPQIPVVLQYFRFGQCVSTRLNSGQALLYLASQLQPIRVMFSPTLNHRVPLRSPHQLSGPVKRSFIQSRTNRPTRRRNHLVDHFTEPGMRRKRGVNGRPYLGVIRLPYRAIEPIGRFLPGTGLQRIRRRYQQRTWWSICLAPSLPAFRTLKRVPAVRIPHRIGQIGQSCRDCRWRRPPRH